MSVFRRETSKGKTEYFHYKFYRSGKTYRGVCEGCRDKESAKKYEQGIKDKISKLSEQKSVKAIVENFRDELSGGNPIAIAEAYELSLKKPRKLQPSNKQIESKRSYWRDFLRFMESKYPEIVNLSEVERKHAEEYLQHLRTKGRFDKQVTYKAKKAKGYKREHNLSPRTCNVFHNSIKEVFNVLAHDAGIIENPFRNIYKLKNDYQRREAFTEDELKLIAEKAGPFILPLFEIGISTALREGDICTLRWREIDFDRNLITKKTHKTGKIVEIPILPPLKSRLIAWKTTARDSEYVLPEHAEMYRSNPGGIGLRVKNFLDGLGIENTIKPKGRTRSVSIKDVHSLRHTFCYLAGVYGIPFLIVKDICGHVSPEMTALYQRHATIEEKRKQLQQMPDFMGLLPEGENKDTAEGSERQHLHSIIDGLSIEKINKVIQFIEKGM